MKKFGTDTGVAFFMWFMIYFIQNPRQKNSLTQKKLKGKHDLIMLLNHTYHYCVV